MRPSVSTYNVECSFNLGKGDVLTCVSHVNKPMLSCCVDKLFGYASRVLSSALRDIDNWNGGCARHGGMKNLLFNFKTRGDLVIGYLIY